MNIKRLKFLDKSFMAALVIMLSFGMLILLSASSGISSDSLYYLKKQLLWLVVGFSLAILIIRYDYTQLEKYWPYIYGISVFMLLVVLIFGKEVRGTTGWIGIGPLPMIQPAEFTKLLLIMAFADFLNKRKGDLNTLQEMIPCFVFMGVPFLLIMLQPDLGTAMVYVAVTIAMMFIAGANPRILFSVVGAIVLLIALVLFSHFQFDTWLPLDDYQIDRLVVFAGPI